MWGEFRISETRRQDVEWVQDRRDKEVGHGVGSGSQRQGGRTWGGFRITETRRQGVGRVQSPEPTESEGCGQNLVFSVQLSFLTAIQESSEHSLEMLKFWVLTLPRLGT